MRFLKKPYRWAICYTLALALFAAYILLDTFVIPRTGVAVESASSGVISAGSKISSSGSSQEEAAQTDSDNTSAAITGTSYQDENIRITIETVYAYDTYVYIADIEVSDAAYLKTAFAQDTYGRNIKETTSSIAKSVGAIFAINSDYYGFRDYGFVLRNGTLYRDTARDAGDDEALLINSEGNFSIIKESETDASALTDAWQVLSFGPALIDNGEIIVTANSEVSQSRSSNPRTAIGQVSALHYIVVVSDGRTDESAGLSLLELAQIMADKGCTVAYNLDGGGSSTMWFNGEVINNPTDGRSSGERSVSDIVYIGY